MSSSKLFEDKYKLKFNQVRNKYIKLYNFVRKSTYNFPEQSHGVDHADCVYKLALKIAIKESVNDLSLEFLEILQAAAMCHDVIDHKYKNVCITETDLINFLNVNTNYTFRIMKIINNISFSKQFNPNQDNETLQEPDNSILTYVRDADRLEAIGNRGIVRCITYNVANGNGINGALKYIIETLMIYSEIAITTKTGKEMAIPLDEEMRQYLNTSLFIDKVFCIIVITAILIPIITILLILAY
jgi:hypothetical protein